MEVANDPGRNPDRAPKDAEKALGLEYKRPAAKKPRAFSDGNTEMVLFRNRGFLVLLRAAQYGEAHSGKPQPADQKLSHRV